MVIADVNARGELESIREADCELAPQRCRTCGLVTRADEKPSLRCSCAKPAPDDGCPSTEHAAHFDVPPGMTRVVLARAPLAGDFGPFTFDPVGRFPVPNAPRTQREHEDRMIEADGRRDRAERLGLTARANVESAKVQASRVVLDRLALAAASAESADAPEAGR